MQKRKELLISLTNQCNLKCTYCNRGDGFDHADGEKLEGFLSDIRKNFIEEVEFICFWGGEPLIYQHFGRLCDFLGKTFSDYQQTRKDKKFSFGINTNGLLLGSKQEQILRLSDSLPEIPIHIYLSLDGVDSSGNIFRKLEKSQVSRIIQNLEKFAQEKEHRKNLIIHISAVLTLSDAAFHQTALLVYLAKKLKIDINFCLQEDLKTYPISFNEKIEENMRDRIQFLRKNNIPVIFEKTGENINKTIRIECDGQIYNYIDTSFGKENAKLIGTHWDARFLGSNDWNIRKNEIQPEDFYKIFYGNDQYIKFIQSL